LFGSPRKGFSSRPLEATHLFQFLLLKIAFLLVGGWLCASLTVLKHGGDHGEEVKEEVSQK
jgi:hypothetical protein